MFAAFFNFVLALMFFMNATVVPRGYMALIIVNYVLGSIFAIAGAHAGYSAARDQD